MSVLRTSTTKVVIVYVFVVVRCCLWVCGVPHANRSVVVAFLVFWFLVSGSFRYKKLLAVLAISVFSTVVSASHLAVPVDPLQTRVTTVHSVTANPHTFNVATFNVWNFNDGHNWTTRVHFVANITTVLLNAVVVLFNEVRHGPQGDMFQDLSNLLVPLGYTGVFQNAMNYSDIQTGEGIAVFSRIPFDPHTVKVRHLHISGHDPGDNNKRVCMYIKFGLPPSNTFHLFATHFSYDFEQQLSNARGVTMFMRSVLTDPHSQNVILMGDFNVIARPDGEVPLSNLKKDLKLVDVAEEAQNTEQTYCNCKQVPAEQADCRLNERIDRVHVSERLRSTATLRVGPAGEIAGVCPSDHRAVVATLPRDHAVVGAVE